MSRHRRPTRADGLRNAATAAAVAGGALAVVTPVVGLEGSGDAPIGESAAAFGLTAADQQQSPARPPATAPRTEPVLAGAPELVRASGLLEATGGAERAVAAERERLARTAREAATAAAKAPATSAPAPASAPAAADRPQAGSCDIDTDGLGDVQSWVGTAARFLGCAYGQPDLLGVGERGNASDHPDGLALDLMVRGEKGDRIAECALDNADQLGVKYVIFQQRMNSGDGWESMEDRGGDTANHMDHVHISFEDGPGSGAPDLGRCA